MLDEWQGWRERREYLSISSAWLFPLRTVMGRRRQRPGSRQFSDLFKARCESPSTPGYGWSSGFHQTQACTKRMPAAPRHQPLGTDGLQDSSRRRHVQNACLRHPAINPWVRMVFRIPTDAGMHKTHACGTPPSTPGSGWSSGFQQTQACIKRMPAAPRHQPLGPDGLQDSNRRRHA